MSDLYVNLYRLIAAVVVIFVFFIAGRPYFSAKMRVLTSAICAGLLNGLVGAALMGSPLSDVPLRFAVAFVGIGLGVAVLEYLFSGRGARRTV